MLLCSSRHYDWNRHKSQNLARISSYAFLNLDMRREHRRLPDTVLASAAAVTETGSFQTFA